MYFLPEYGKTALKCKLQIFEIKSNCCHSCGTVYRCKTLIDVNLSVNNSKYPRGGKNNPYNGNFNNGNKTYLPARTTTLGYEKTE